MIKRYPLRNLSNIEAFFRTKLFLLAEIRSLRGPKEGCQKHIRFHSRALHPSTLAKDLTKLLNPMYNHKLKNELNLKLSVSRFSENKSDSDFLVQVF